MGTRIQSNIFGHPIKVKVEIYRSALLFIPNMKYNRNRGLQQDKKG